jgi:hypothetical protein
MVIAKIGIREASMGENTTSDGPFEGRNLRFERETFGMFFRLYCCGKGTL